MFLERAWYFASWSDRLARGAIVNIALIGKDIALFRAEDGELGAVAERCPHKFAALHRGKVVGHAIECPYHGLRFDARGRCVFSPHHSGAIPPIGTTSYTVVERHGAIWLWMSQDHQPDETLLPDLSELVTAVSTSIADLPTMHVAANYMLVADNLFDPAHADFVHHGALGNGGHCGVKGKVTVLDRGIKASWTWKGTGPVPFLNRLMPDPDNVETWLTCTLFAPGIVRLENGVRPLDQPESEGIFVVAFHIFMPSSETTTVYDVRSIRNHQPHDAEATAHGREFAIKLFNEQDRPMLEDQQRLMNGRDFWELKPTLFPADNAAAAVRRRMTELIRQEHAIRENVCQQG